MTPITVLPCTIALPGRYQLSLSGSAVYFNGNQTPPVHPITITANDVCLDFNGNSIINLGGGPTTQVKGVYVASNLINIKICNGVLRGFFYGIHFDDRTYQRSITIEKMLIQNSTFRGIVATGGYNHIRDCVIEGVSGCTVHANAYCMGIECLGQTLIERNTILEVYGTGTGEGVPVSCTDYGINSLVRRNWIANRDSNPNTWGIWVGGNSHCFAVENSIINMAHGLAYSTATGGQRDNEFIQCGVNIVGNPDNL